MNTVNPGSSDGGAFSADHGPNAVLRADEFPFHKLANPDDPRSAVMYDSNDVVGSQGVMDRNNYGGTIAGSYVDDCLSQADPVFHVGSQNVRRVTGRKAPTNINAVFQRNDFWDGRASHIFNGVNPRGVDGGNPSVYQTINGVISQVHVQIDNAALASQATGPGLSPVEMSCDGRVWPAVGHKLLGLQPLGRQQVAADDSVLGRYSDTSGTGLKTGYLDLINAAYQPQWISDQPVVINGRTYTQTEANFSLFWGLSIQLYESTLVSDKTPFDSFATGNRAALTAEQQRGLDIFNGKGQCAKCHTGSVFTDATDSANDGFAGFHATGVRPLADDAGAGGAPVNRTQDAGKFKTPTLRNIELTGKYMHNGGMATLEQVVDFYNRGGDFHDNPNLDGRVKQLGLRSADKHALVAFMLSLTDERVRHQSAPFDHPQLFVPDGETIVGATVSDNLIEIPATGRNGGAPLPTFQDSLGIQPCG
jgi:cytochrome c peroxidase